MVNKITTNDKLKCSEYCIAEERQLGSRSDDYLVNLMVRKINYENEISKLLNNRWQYCTLILEKNKPQIIVLDKEKFDSNMNKEANLHTSIDQIDVLFERLDVILAKIQYVGFNTISLKGIQNYIKWIDNRIFVINERNRQRLGNSLLSIGSQGRSFESIKIEIDNTEEIQENNAVINDFQEIRTLCTTVLNEANAVIEEYKKEISNKCTP